MPYLTVPNPGKTQGNDEGANSKKTVNKFFFLQHQTEICKVESRGLRGTHRTQTNSGWANLAVPAGTGRRRDAAGCRREAGTAEVLPSTPFMLLSASILSKLSLSDPWPLS